MRLCAACCALLLSSALLCSCAVPHAGYQTGETVLIPDVPFYPDTGRMCGPAALAGALNSLGASLNPEDIAPEIFSAAARGTLTADMAWFAQTRGFAAREISGTMIELRKQIDSGRPLVVLVDSAPWIVDRNHFMLVVGYTREGVIANSGKKRHRFIDNSRFLRIWSRTGNSALLLDQPDPVE